MSNKKAPKPTPRKRRRNYIEETDGWMVGQPSEKEKKDKVTKRRAR